MLRNKKKVFTDKLQFTSYIHYHTFLQEMQLRITHPVVAEVNSVLNAVARSQKIKKQKNKLTLIIITIKLLRENYIS